MRILKQARISQGKTMQESFEMIDPEETARQRRDLMINVDTMEYYVADYFKSDMANDTPITERYFRVRKYIKPRDASDPCQEWLDAPASEVWSTKFLGLSKSGFQKLEFQNPPYVAAFRLGGDPRHYNDTFVVQLNGCDFECSFCFVDRELNKPELGKGKYFRVKDIVDAFLRERARYSKEGKELNVIRLSGGEITCLVPELILGVHNEISKRGLSDCVYIWADCNLSTLTYLRDVQNDLRRISREKNFGVVGCLKTAGDGQTGSNDFSHITKALPEYFSKQFDVLDFFVNTIKADTYVYLVPIVYGQKATYRARLHKCLRRLMRIHRNLPLRTNVLQIRNYSPVEKNIRTAFREGRPLPKYNDENFDYWYNREFVQAQKTISKIWYKEMLPAFYTANELTRYRCQVPLR